MGRQQLGLAKMGAAGLGEGGAVLTLIFLLISNFSNSSHFYYNIVAFEFFKLALVQESLKLGQTECLHVSDVCR